MAPVYGTPYPVTPGVSAVLAPNPSPFTLHGTQTFLVDGDALAIIDPGPASDEHVEAVLAAVGGRPVSGIFVTHTHNDHSPATPALAHALGGPPVYAFGPHGSGIGREVPPKPGSDMDFNPDVRLADGQTVRGDGWEIEAIHTPGHASNHLCFALKGRDVLFAGDHVMGWSTTLVSPPDGDMGQYIASLRKLLGRPERTFIPGHGDPIDDPAALVSRVLNRRLERRGEIMQCVRSGASTITAVLNELYVGLNPKLARAARSTVFAHLIELVEAGCAVTDGPPDPDGSFRAA